MQFFYIEIQTVILTLESRRLLYITVFLPDHQSCFMQTFSAADSRITSTRQIKYVKQGITLAIR